MPYDPNVMARGLGMLRDRRVREGMAPGAANQMAGRQGLMSMLSPQAMQAIMAHRQGQMGGQGQQGWQPPMMGGVGQIAGGAAGGMGGPQGLSPQLMQALIARAQQVAQQPQPGAPGVGNPLQQQATPSPSPQLPPGTQPQQWTRDWMNAPGGYLGGSRFASVGGADPTTSVGRQLPGHLAIVNGRVVPKASQIYQMQGGGY
jgi:hypothetical protein